MKQKNDKIVSILKTNGIFNPKDFLNDTKPIGEKIMIEIVQIHSVEPNNDESKVHHNNKEISEMEQELIENLNTIMMNNINLKDISVPDDIWAIIFEYTYGNNFGLYIAMIHVEKMQNYFIGLSIYMTTKIIYDLILFIYVIIYFANNSLVSNESNEYTTWQKYQMFNGTLAVSYFIPNPLFSIFLLSKLLKMDILDYVSRNENFSVKLKGNKYNLNISSKKIAIWFIRYYIVKHMFQILIGLPLFVIGITGFWTWVVIVPFIAIAVMVKKIKQRGASKYFLIWAIFGAQFWFLLSFNIVYGYMWFVAAIRTFCGWDTCYANHMFLPADKEYTFTEIVVWINYWLG